MRGYDVLGADYGFDISRENYFDFANLTHKKLEICYNLIMKTRFDYMGMYKHFGNIGENLPVKVRPL